MVTDGASDIGTSVVDGLLRLGATVHCIVPDSGQGARLRAHMPAEMRERLMAHAGDLSRLEETRTLAEVLLSTTERIDVLVDLAETFSATFHETIDGIERTFAYNHLSRFLLTNLLMARLRASSPARIISASSVAHLHHRVDPEDWENRDRYDGWIAYCRSKQCDLLFVKALARRLDPAAVTANAVDLGLRRDVVSKERLPVHARILRPFLTKAPETSVDSLLWLAASPEVEKVTGRYFVKREMRKPAAETEHEDLQEALWATSLERTGTGVHGAKPLGGPGGLPVFR